MFLRRLPTALLLVLLLGACGLFGGSEEPAPSPAPARTSPAPTEEPSPEPSPTPGTATLITPQAVGPVELGVAGDALAGVLGPDYAVEGPRQDLFVDHVLYEIAKDGQVQMWAGWLAGEPPTISVIITGNPAYRTAEGVGPGATIEQAVESYGRPTLSYSLSNEGREYADFPDRPAPRMRFQTGNATDLAGVYGEQDEFNQTTEWRPGATVRYVLISP